MGMNEKPSSPCHPRREEDEAQQKQRHSCAHLMAAAIQQLWPEAQFGVGPATKTGFYYDVLLPTPLKEGDLTAIEKKMIELQKRNLPYIRSEVLIDDAIALMEKLKQPFKVELLQLLKNRGSTAVEQEEAGVVETQGLDRVSLYQTGDFVDLCRGPHVEKSGDVGIFKLRSLAGAYWRGDEKNPQLQRIHAVCYASKEDLDHALWQMEQAELRDHRKLGKELQLFTFSQDVGPGLPLWLPKGTVLRDELERLAVQEERSAGYRRVSTPQITKEALYIRSGQALEESGYPYVEAPGEAAFYGPKVDFMIRSVIGTEYAISTNQLDFLAAKRFDLNYVAQDGSEQPVYVIHRAPLGSHERFVAFLIEQYAGAFPVWLSPVQARIISISDRHREYAQKVWQEIFEAPVETASGGIRVDIDGSEERMQKKIRNAQQEKIPYMLVVGDQEVAQGTISVRRRDGQDMGTMPICSFVDRLKIEIRSRRDLL